jgi:hypothetical protein
MVTQATVAALTQLYAEEKEVIDHIIAFSHDERERNYMILIKDIANGLYTLTEPITSQQPVVQAAV